MRKHPGSLHAAVSGYSRAPQLANSAANKDPYETSPSSQNHQPEQHGTARFAALLHWYLAGSGIYLVARPACGLAIPGYAPKTSRVTFAVSKTQRRERHAVYAQPFL